jgi:hypothetical protein
VSGPILRVTITDIEQEFDKIRALLEPIQIWFFQKRRVVRLIDKVFDKEFNLTRVDEFSTLVAGRLRRKHQSVLENSRKIIRPDESADLEFIKTAPPIDLVELFLFEERRIPATNAVNRRLVELTEPSAFHVMHRIFPDTPRDVSDVYMGNALIYLMRLAERQPLTLWMPSWLTKESAAASG